ncbi:MAG: hypothetical protein V1872_03975 [bacterium]
MSCRIRPSTTDHIKDEKKYSTVQRTFRHRWWNYYESGLSFAEDKFFLEAVPDFKEAIQQRIDDQRMARTYGMHFIDYFPHRELGVIYYEMGKLKEAETELELSIENFPSAKARFYLDQVRKKTIEYEGKEVNSPALNLDLKGEHIWTKEDPITISGVAEDKCYIAGITIKGSPLFLESSQKRISFKESLNLSQGQNLIEVEAKNLLGKVTRQQIIIHVDREGPTITISDFQFAQDLTKKKYNYYRLDI